MENIRALKIPIFIFIVLLTITWSVINIGSTVSSLADGRSISISVLTQSEEYLAINSSEEVITQIKMMKEDGRDTPIFGEWLLSSYYGDSLNYMKMAMGYASHEPYSLRPAYPSIVGFASEGLMDIFNISIDRKFQVYSFFFIFFNLSCFILSIIFGAKFLSRIGLTPQIAFFISFLSFMQLGYLKTLYSPMTDQPAVLAALLFLASICNKDYFKATMISIICILMKDSLIILGVVPGLLFLRNRDYRYFMVCVTMLLTFISLRVFSNVDPLSMQYGWNVSKGEIHFNYLKSHFNSLSSIMNLGIGHFYSFGPAWLVSILLLSSRRVSKEERFLVITLFVTALVFSVAQVMLASRVARTLTPASVLLFMTSFGLAIKYYKIEFEVALEHILQFKRQK